MVKVVRCPAIGKELFGNEVYRWPLPDEGEKPKYKPKAPTVVQDVTPIPRKRISVGKKV